MALSEIKTNIQKWETKDEPQTNGSYKIKQIIIKIMEYTHIQYESRAHVLFTTDSWCPSQVSGNTCEWKGESQDKFKRSRQMRGHYKDALKCAI